MVAGILWFFSNWFILKRQNWPPGKNFRKLCTSFSTFSLLSRRERKKKPKKTWPLSSMASFHSSNQSDRRHGYPYSNATAHQCHINRHSTILRRPRAPGLHLHHRPTSFCKLPVLGARVLPIGLGLGRVWMPRQEIWLQEGGSRTINSARIESGAETRSRRKRSGSRPRVGGGHNSVERDFILKSVLHNNCAR